jgi:hypothetical protein
MLSAGALRACWSVGLAFIHPGIAGIVLVIAVQFDLVTCVGVFNPVLATYRLDQTETDRIARTLSAWSVTSNVTIAALTALWGLLGQHHRPPHGDCDCRCPLAGHPAPAASTRPRAAARAGSGPEPYVIRRNSLPILKANGSGSPMRASHRAGRRRGQTISSAKILNWVHLLGDERAPVS